ncbi:MAG: hypothetical protein A2785_02695 [Candidatus Chisholmbacteria bacterium RIFCSPHIGHO2_01_FULL_49_18]|uniref:DNA 3'-5' helicase n=1 Tax=Candidatus Chisholmbacteria bacterium RIFCSPHIGHO2_01_FULL_49_18 TaxID=1797590 RepID=A0A1G1VL26_9BACT|nr:MAG: hypothetical protein A2785_02695 [Candidatus Chisholmbacteria bacterium RIFCSPHIGHO2_01_FULL_49_18]
MSSSFLDQLNTDQRAAVTFGDGPLLILAGAGSGKTRVIVYRVAYLLQKKSIDPSRILLTTFTNKAAGEMRDRLQRLAGAAPPFTGTFHSLCAKLLRKHGSEIGISPAYSIYDEAEQEDIVKQAISTLGLSTRDYKPRSVLGAISGAKNELIGPTEYPQYARGHWQKAVATIYLSYQKLLRKYEALDFDDLLMDTVHLFQRAPSILKTYQDRFRYVLVDEYQDTNHAQYVLTKLLVGRWRNLTCVGDFSQSIYRWRGADFRNLNKLQTDFPDLTTINLEQNYRSTQNILDAAHGVISHNTTHPVLHLWTNNRGGEKIGLFEARDEKEEAEFVLQQIYSLKDGAAKRSLSEFAVLYRTNAQSRVIEELFIRKGIPYVLVGGTRFYSRREIKDCLSFLRFLANPKDLLSRQRIEKLGKKRFEHFLEFKKNLQETTSRSRLTTLELLDQVLEVSEYLKLFDPKDEEDLMRLENIKELRSVATEFPQLPQFLENVALVEQEYLPDHPLKQGKRQDAITLMTLHAAKGLEFPVVFMIGMEEGLFPHSRSMLEKEDLEEERRLCYVGITRAMDRVFLTFARRRLYFGSYGSNLISRFLQEIPEQLLSSVDALTSLADVSSYFEHDHSDDVNSNS